MDLTIKVIQNFETYQQFKKKNKTDMDSQKLKQQKRNGFYFSKWLYLMIWCFYYEQRHSRQPHFIFQWLQLK